MTQTTVTHRYFVEPGGRLEGAFRVPGDKSISHRAIMLGAIADGVTRIKGFLEGADSRATIDAFRAMGVSIETDGEGRVTIEGVGKLGLKAPAGPIDCGNSGTTMRLLSGLLSAQPFESELIGDESLMKRPMARVADPLRSMGARIETSPDGRPPIRIHPATLTGIDYTLPMPSAQVKSALMLAGLYASGVTRIAETIPSRDHTERMLQTFRCRVERQIGVASVSGNAALSATEIVIPGDLSSAAFFIVGATITPGSDISLLDVGVNPTRTGVIDILNVMGADIALENHRNAVGEPLANLRIRSARLTGIEIPAHLVPLAIDEFPAIFIAAAVAEGETILRGARELRVKESDRIETMAEGLRTLGVEVETFDDGIRIVGRPNFRGGKISARHDHRVAMAFSMAALRSQLPIEIEGCEVVATSFPGFVELAREAGLSISEGST